MFNITNVNSTIQKDKPTIIVEQLGFLKSRNKWFNEGNAEFFLAL